MHSTDSRFQGAGSENLVEIPQLQPLRLESFTRLLCATTDALMIRVLKTAKVPQLQYSDKVVDVLAVQVVVLPQVQFQRL